MIFSFRSRLHWWNRLPQNRLFPQTSLASNANWRHWDNHFFEPITLVHSLIESIRLLLLSFPLKRIVPLFLINQIHSMLSYSSAESHHQLRYKQIGMIGFKNEKRLDHDLLLRSIIVQILCQIIASIYENLKYTIIYLVHT